MGTHLDPTAQLLSSSARAEETAIGQTNSAIKCENRVGRWGVAGNTRWAYRDHRQRHTSVPLDKISAIRGVYKKLATD